LAIVIIAWQAVDQANIGPWIPGHCPVRLKEMSGLLGSLSASRACHQNSAGKGMNDNPAEET